MQIVISGSAPSKKNDRQIFVRNGRIVSIPSARHKAWQDSALAELASQYKGSVDGACIVICQFYFENKRLKDLDNSLSSVLDVLVKSGLLPDDNYLVVPEVHAIFGGIDKENPRTEVTIEEVDPVR